MPFRNHLNMISYEIPLKIRWTRPSGLLPKYERGYPCVGKKSGAKIAVCFEPALTRDGFERKPGMSQQNLGAFESQSREVLSHGNSLQPLKEMAQIVLAHPGVKRHFSHALNRSKVLLHESACILNNDFLRIKNRDFALRDRAKPQEKCRDTKVQDA